MAYNFVKRKVRNGYEFPPILICVNGDGGDKIDKGGVRSLVRKEVVRE